MSDVEGECAQLMIHFELTLEAIHARHVCESEYERKYDTYLNRNLAREVPPSPLGLLESPDNVVKTSRTPEVLLLKTKLLTPLKRVVRVQDVRNRLSTLLIGHRALILSRVELLEIKLATSSLGPPKSQVIGGRCAVTWDWNVVRHGVDNLTTLPSITRLALVVLELVNVPVELDIDRDIVAREFPRIEVEPVIGNLDLVTVDDFLLKDTIAVAEAVAPGRVVEGCHAVEEAGGETAETAVSEGGVVFLADYVFHAET